MFCSKKASTKILVASAAIGLLATACGGGASEEEPAGSAATETSTESDDEETDASQATDDEQTDASQATDDLREVSVRLDWTPLGYHAPFLVAEELGYYAEEGLTVKVGEGKGSVTAAQVVATGQDEFGWVDLAAVMPLMAEGAPIKAAAVVAQRPTSFVAALAESDITEPSDLAGKTIGISVGGAITEDLVALFLDAAGVDSGAVDVIGMDSSAKSPALVNGDVDAIFANTTAQMPQFEEMGVDISGIMLGDYVSLLSYSIVANGDLLEEEPEVVEGFVRATLRAWEWTEDNPEDAVEMLAAEFAGINNVTTPLRQLEEVFPLLHTERSTDMEIGNPHPDDILDTESLLYESGVLDTETGDTSTYFSDVFFD